VGKSTEGKSTCENACATDRPHECVCVAESTSWVVEEYGEEKGTGGGGRDRARARAREPEPEADATKKVKGKIAKVDTTVGEGRGSVVRTECHKTTA
jgi:hypothetical protein